MLPSSHQPFPSSCFQAKVAFSPSKMAFDNSAKAEVMTPATDKRQGCESGLSSSARIVVNDKTGVEHKSNEVQQWISEVCGISPNDGNWKMEKADCQSQQWDGNWAVM